MKRSPLKRYTPLRAERPLARRYWASTPKLDGPRARRSSDPTPAQREAALKRTAGMCALHPECGLHAVEVHHRKLRKHGGDNRIENLLPLCAWHHDSIHANPERSYAEGWLIHAWDAVTPWPERWFR